MKILVVDDERLLVKGIKFNLENEGYTVETAFNGEDGVALAKTGQFDLIILDLMMPKLDGLGACMQIREFSTVPIIMLTAKSEDMDKIIGFEYGADDYLTKPFNILELKARIKALLRRSGAGASQPQQTLVTVAGITVDAEKRTAARDGRVVELTGKEFDLMELLIKNPGKVFSREKLLDLIWGSDYQGDIRTVDVHVHKPAR